MRPLNKLDTKNTTTIDLITATATKAQHKLQIMQTITKKTHREMKHNTGKTKRCKGSQHICRAIAKLSQRDAKQLYTQKVSDYKKDTKKSYTQQLRRVCVFLSVPRGSHVHYCINNDKLKTDMRAKSCFFSRSARQPAALDKYLIRLSSRVPWQP